MRVEEKFNLGVGTPVLNGKCTIHYYSDSEPAQIVKMSPSGKTIWIRKNIVEADKSKELYTGHQNWIIHENEFETVCCNWKTGEEYDEMKLADEPDWSTYFKATLRKNGSYKTVGSDLYVSIGQWHKYYDWSF